MFHSDIKFVVAIALTVTTSIVIDIVVSLFVLLLRHILLSSFLMFSQLLSASRVGIDVTVIPIIVIIFAGTSRTGSIVK